MSREVRRVPKDWVHPRDPEGRLIPLLSDPFSKRLREWKEGKRQWALGFVWSSYDNCWTAKEEYHKDMSYEDYDGAEPTSDMYMPEWTPLRLTHLQMYETCTEGTPISPVMKTAEELAHWLADNEASAFGYETATYEEWLAMIKAGWAPSAIATPETGLISGVSAMAMKEVN